MRKFKVKQDISLDKIGRHKSAGRLKSVEQTTRGSVQNVRNASQVSNLSVCQQRREKLPPKGENGKVTSRFVSVVSSTKQPLMPTTAYRARQLVKQGRAVRRFKTGIFYIQLVDRAEGSVQPIACGIDPGSKREAFTVKSESHTYLNVLSDAVTWVKDAVKTRREMRRNRRFRNTPCRQNRMNRSKSPFPPSTKARWQAKIRIVNILRKLYPISHYIVEDIKAKTTGKRRWDMSFSPLEVGKKWFYSELSKLGSLDTLQGYETKELRDNAHLIKCKSKMKESFDTHCIDSWVLANYMVGGHIQPENTDFMRLISLQFHRRQLHRLQAKKGFRTRYGGTMSLGLKRGSIVKHIKYGITYVGGYASNRLSLHNLNTGDRLCLNAKLEDTIFLANNSWRSNLFSSANKD